MSDDVLGDMICRNCVAFEGTNTQASYVNVASGSAVNSNTSLIRGADFVRADESDDMLGQLTIDSILLNELPSSD